MTSQKYQSTKTDSELNWMKQQLDNQSQSYVDKNSFLTDTAYYLVNSLSKSTKFPCYLKASSGMGTMMIAKKTSSNSKITIIMMSYEDSNWDKKITEFSKGCHDINSSNNYKSKLMNDVISGYFANL